MIRTFVAIELDASVRQTLAQIQAMLRTRLQRAVGPDVRVQWVKPESIHLTLKFLGDISEDRVPGIQAALARAASGHVRFAVTVEGLGVFPDVRAPRVVWAGFTAHGDALNRLAADVETALAAIGCLPDPKPFHPHLTLARIKEGSRNAGRALSDGGVLARATPRAEATVAGVSLMKSDRQPSRSVYAQLCHVPLKEA